MKWILGNGTYVDLRIWVPFFERLECYITVLSLEALLNKGWCFLQSKHSEQCGAHVGVGAARPRGKYVRTNGLKSQLHVHKERHMRTSVSSHGEIWAARRSAVRPRKRAQKPRSEYNMLYTRITIQGRSECALGIPGSCSKNMRRCSSCVHESK